MKPLHLFFVLFLLFANVLQVSSAVRYVKSGATGNGNSWTSASGDLQAIINESSNGDQIWVAAGTYIPNRQINSLNVIASGSRNNAFVVSKNIQLYGGFAGLETDIDEREGSDNQTILSGAVGSGNSYHVLLFANGCDALFDGFTITGGNADGNTPVVINGKEYRQNVGGGILIMHSSPRINNVIIRDNSAVHGGGIAKPQKE